ncbi:MAG: hypothetical protein V2A69_05670 [Pseudomonadota bacterium]
MGTGRMMGTERQIPVFVPEGNYQDELFEKAIDYLSKGGFILLDVRNISYETAISTLKLDWPTLVDKWPRDKFKANIIESESRLLIVCGKENHPRFWKFLCGESLLYTGSVLPPIRDISPRCFVIPDRASVAALIKHRDFYDNYPLEFFGPVGTFNSNTVPFTL